MKKFLTSALAVLLSFTILTSVNAEEVETKKFDFTVTAVEGDELNWKLDLTVESEDVTLDGVTVKGFSNETVIPAVLTDGVYTINMNVDSVIVELMSEEAVTRYNTNLTNLTAKQAELDAFLVTNEDEPRDTDGILEDATLAAQEATLKSELETLETDISGDRLEFTQVVEYTLNFKTTDGSVGAHTFNAFASFAAGQVVTVDVTEVTPEPEPEPEPEDYDYSITGEILKKDLDSYTGKVVIDGEGVTFVDAFALIKNDTFALQDLTEVEGGFTYSLNEHYHLLNLLEGAELAEYEEAYKAAVAETATRTTSTSAVDALQAIKSKHINYVYLFEKGEEFAVAIVNDFAAQLVGKNLELTFTDIPVTPEVDNIGLEADLSDIEWVVGTTVQFSDIKFYLVNYTQGTYVEVPYEEIEIVDNNDNVTTEYTIPTVFHDDMNGKVFRATFEVLGHEFSTIFDTNLFLPKGVSVSFDSLNVSINYGLDGAAKNGGVNEYLTPDLKYIESVTTYQQESMIETSYGAGEIYSTMSQEVVFQKPGTYNIPVLHVVTDDEGVVQSSTKVDEVQVIVSTNTNEKLSVSYEGKGTKFDLDALKITGNITGENHGIAVDTEQLFIYDDNNNLVDENYKMAPGTETTVHVTYYPNRLGRLLNHTVHYGSTVVKLDTEGNVVPVGPTTPPTGLANYGTYYVMVAGLAAVVLLVAKKSRKANN